MASTSVLAYNPFSIENVDKDKIRSMVTIRDKYISYSNMIYEAFERSHCLGSGHFSLLSGLHSDIFMRFRLFHNERPETQFNYIKKFAEMIYEMNKPLFQSKPADFVLTSTAIGPKKLGEEFCHVLEKNKLQPIHILTKEDESRRPYKIKDVESYDFQNKNIYILSDLTTTLYGIRTLIELLKESKGVPCGIFLFASRYDSEKRKIAESTLTKDLGDITLDVITDLHLEQWDRKKCELCWNGKPVAPAYRLI
jgi:orotate phosphoribosyltransferase